MIYTLPQAVEASAKAFPTKEAFRCIQKSYSYQELEAQMNQLAHFLIQNGVQKGDRVGVYLNRCLESALAIYGIMQAGAVFVPLDPLAPIERIKYLLEDCEIQFVISQNAQSKKLEQLLTLDTRIKGIIGLQKDWALPTYNWEHIQATMPSTKPAVKVLADDLAYIMYTSGTTGTPKGIMHTHYSGLSYAKLSADLYELTNQDRVGNHAALHFDISTFGYLSAPLVGATTIIVPDAHTKMPASLSSLMEKEKLTIWYSVPLALIQLVQRGVLEERDLSSLRWVLFGGEPFPPKFLRSLMESWPQASFSNVYGPAEVNQCTYYTIPAVPTNDQPLPLGYVWGNTEMLILNHQDEAVSLGETGELLIRSATRMKGYWKRPDLTDRGFYINPGNTGIPKIFYRTGDLVRLDEAGLLHFLGRKDRQIKTRGYRVELDEVEALLIAHQAVEEAAVFAYPHPESGLLIGAAVTLKADQTIAENELQKHIGQVLPWYAVPQQINITHALPRTAAGKINRKVLVAQAKG